MAENYIQFISSAPPAWEKGGPTRLSHSYLAIALQAFSRVCVVSVGKGNSERQQIAAAVGIVDTDVVLTWPISSRRPLGLIMPSSWLKITDTIRRGKITILHLLEFKSTLMLYAVVYRKLFPGRTRLVHSAFGQLSTIDYSNLATRILCKFYLSGVDVILCQSAEEAAAVQALIQSLAKRPVTVRTLPLSVLDAPPSYISGGTVRACSAPFSVKTAIFLGRIVPEKGVIEAIRFLCALPIELRPASFSIFGPSSDKEYERQIAMEIDFSKAAGVTCKRSGIADPSTRYGQYAAGDLFVMLPIVKEESSLATIEALITGCKVIINTNCMIPHAKRFPTMVLVVGPNIDHQAIAVWLKTAPSTQEVQLAQTLFVENGRDQFLEALN